jgi:hypothetical protein
MTSEKLEQLRADLLDFESKHPRSRDDVHEQIDCWLADAAMIARRNLNLAALVYGAPGSSIERVDRRLRRRLAGLPSVAARSVRRRSVAPAEEAEC